MQNETNQTVPTNSSHQLESLSTIYIVCIIMGIVAIALNATVIYLFTTRKYLQKSLSNIFLLNLALSDLCYGLVTLPLCIICIIPGGKICFAYHFFMIFTDDLSVYQILLGIIEKFFAICFTMKHYLIFTRSLAIKLCITVWIMSAVIAHIPQWWNAILVHQDRGKMKKAFNIFHIVFVFAIPLIASAIMYTLMLRRISKHLKTMESLTESIQQQQSSSLKNERKTALIFGLLFTVFLVCWTGWFVVTSFRDQIFGNTIKEDPVEKRLINFCLVMRILAAILNPLLYTFIKNDFRKALMSLGNKTLEVDIKISTKKALIKKEQKATSNQHETTL